MEIKLSLDQINWKPLNKGWQFCVGSGNAKLALQSDYQAQLKQVHDELGFKRVRFHGLFNDGLYVVRELNHIFNVGVETPHIREISFQQIGKVLDSIIECGVEPFIELGMMPKVFASNSQTLFQYKDYVSPPSQIQDWNNLIQLFLEFLIDRYGLDVVKKWYFEVWNEPDISNFWSGTQEDYFHLYKHTAETVKKVCSDFQVGGPATSKTRWINDFYKFCRETNTPVDFISTHQYPGDALGHSFNRESHMEKMNRVLQSPSNSMVDVARSVFCNEEKIKQYPSNLLVNNAKIAKQQARELPLYYTEWNTTSICVAPHNDTHMSAAYIVKTCIESDDIIDGSSFWTFSDIFEELAYFTDPFSGSFGLVTIDGIEKPNYYGFKLLNALKKNKFIIMDEDDHKHISMYRDENTLQLLITNHHFDMSVESEFEYSFSIADIKSVINVHENEIGENTSNSYKIWLDMGQPKPLSKFEIADIREKSRMVDTAVEYNFADNQINFRGTIKTNHTKLITIQLGE